jgi:uncharacterized protein (DUF302 family)
MRASALLAAVLLLATAMSAPAAAGPPGLIVKTSSHSVGRTLDKLENLLDEKGITVFARVDHAAGAADVGLDLPATQLLIFGNPKLGTPLMQAGRTAAIDLPMKALAYRGADGTVRLAYNDPAYLAERHGIVGRAKLLDKMAAALDGLTDAATAR